MPNSAEDVANAQVELEEAKTYRRKGGDLHDANDGAPQLSGLRRENLEVAERPVDRDRTDPSLLVILYHAYDGRVVTVPRFMAAHKLAERFPAESFIPAKWHKQRAWFLEPQAEDQNRLNLPCMFHENQSEEVKALVRAAGLTPGSCRKNNIPSEYALERHMTLKHGEPFKAINRVRDRHREDEWRNEQRRQNEAILELAKAMRGDK